MKKLLLISILFFICLASVLAQEFWTLDFESPGGYSTSVAEFSDGSGDYFIRTDGTNISSTVVYSNLQGSYYFAAQDIDGEGASKPLFLEISSIDISGKTGIGFSVFLAEDEAADGNEDWDGSDYIHFQYSIDGGLFQELLWIENDGSTFNGSANIDTDFDGVGDGDEILPVFTEVAIAIPETGNSLDIKIIFNNDAGDEDIAIDNLKLSGAGVAPVLASPIFNPPGGTFYSPFNVELSTTAANANIYYTFDETNPSSFSTKYIEPIPISATTTIKAISHDGTDSSAVSTAVYNYVNPAPVISNITQTPSNPDTTETVVITAEVTDDLTVVLVEIKWGTTAGNLTNSEIMVNSSGDTFTGLISPQKVGNVFYSVQAKDNGNAISNSPEQSYYVALPPLGIPVALSASSIKNDRFTANWNIVPGATNYLIDVSTEPNFEGSSKINQNGLIISEVIEGSSYNKAIEIFNGTGAPIDLQEYKIQRDYNGDNNFAKEFELFGILENGKTFVLCHPSAGSTIKNKADVENTICNFNGNDQLRLVKNSTVIDHFGKSGNIDFNKDLTFIRYKHITSASATFNEEEWQKLPKDLFGYLGSHKMDIAVQNVFVNGFYQFDMGNTDCFEISGLYALTNYYYRLRAKSTNETTVASNVIYVKTAEPPVAYLNVKPDTICEDSLHGAEVEIGLVLTSFIDGILPASSFILKNAPEGLEIEEIDYQNSTHATIVFAFQNADFDVDFSQVSLEIAGGELSRNYPLESNPFYLKSVVETVLPEPSNHVSNLVVVAESITQISFEITWTENEEGNLPTGYLIVADTSEIIPPVDGTDPLAFDSDLTDGSGQVKVPTGTNSFAFTNCSPETTYKLAVFPFSNELTDIDFKIDSFPSIQVQTLAPFILQIPAAPATFEATSLTDSSFVANWDNSDFATTYFIDVATDSLFTENGTITSGIFISEYVEGSGYNKAIEIYNGTGGPVDLLDYKLQKDVNGDNDFSTEIFLSGILQNEDVFVACHTSASDEIKAVADLQNGTIINFNGNDQVRLVKIDGTLVDHFGLSGGSDFAKDQTFVRNAEITSGNPDWNINEWTTYLIDDFSHLGTHSVNKSILASSFIAGFQNLEVGDTTQLEVNGLELQTCFYRIRAANNLGTSENSNVIRVDLFNDTPIPEVAKLSELRNQELGEVYKFTGSAVVTFTQDYRNQKFIQDSTGAILIDDSTGVISKIYVEGDGISNLIGELTEYNGMLEFIPEIDPGLPFASGLEIDTLAVEFIDGIDPAWFEENEARLARIPNLMFDLVGEMIFETGTVYDLQQVWLTSGIIDQFNLNFRTSFYDVNYIGTEILHHLFDITGILNYNDGAYLTARRLTDFEIGKDNATQQIFDPTDIHIFGSIGKIEIQTQIQETSQVEIFNLSGQLIYSGLHFSTNIEIPVRQQGVYLVKCKIGKQNEKRKVIVQ